MAKATWLSMVMFTGASQFALVSILTAGGGAASAVSTALLLGSRNLLHTVRFRTIFPARWLTRPRLRQATALVPVSLLSALIATQTFSSGRALGLDARAPPASASPRCACGDGSRSSSS
jgi:hypothetical protein